MEKKALLRHVFRSIPVQRAAGGERSEFFRSIPVHLKAWCSGGFGRFPEHIRSKNRPSAISCASTDSGASEFFRSISVHFMSFFRYICMGSTKASDAVMAGKIKNMSLIKQVLQLKERGESNRGIARQLPINKETVGYKIFNFITD